jgi:glycerol-3-phosphate acyltransferase PlsY
MSPLLTAALLWGASYLIGAIPFGYLIARMKGVDLFKAGSGNIGATNVGRTLGRKYGLLVFTLDFLKGSGPVAAVVPLARSHGPDAETALGSPGRRTRSAPATGSSPRSASSVRHWWS